ncbi:MAG TPA: protein-L-isoaspartate(D-aspartate) O-methyltransferase [Saprospiraceae bacterium]|nr:protein-L-isoaspartate(D-aspartate) O-methyltransferase [Saprospiraceae bacterium]HRG64678.1 protein-L-isoaspartate(D-aspartate) O-methyltransferase [Saprospiraceae bacterium]
MQDTFRHKGLRRKLVDHLRQRGIRDQILQAVENVPRHWFMDGDFDVLAYRDTAFRIDADQTISHPYTVAFMTQLLDITPGEKILEIGTGSGYQACILGYLGAKVYTIERQHVLFQKTSALLPKIGFNAIRTLYGDGFAGAPRFAPFDSIVVTAGASTFPVQLWGQLKVGGKMVIPMGVEGQQQMFKFTKVDENNYHQEEHGAFQFVPFLKGVSI